MLDETRSIENPAVPVSSQNFFAMFGVSSGNLPHVTTDSALTVPAVLAAVGFLSRTLAALPLHAFRKTDGGPEKLADKVAIMIHENPNDIMDGFKFRQYFWQQVFTAGRGLAYIERVGRNPDSLWPMDPTKVRVQRVGFKLQYDFDGKIYPAEDVIDVPFMLKPDGVANYSPIQMGAKAIQLSLAMNDYGSNFFAGGGVPPLAMTGPLPQGPEAMRRAMAEVHRAIDAAKASDKPLFPMPPGHELKPVGIEPGKGQMTEARRFQIEEIARVYQIPPVFLQDLSHATFSNAEQQDLHLVKHLIAQWAKALEGEMNLKLFGRMNNRRFAKHNLDGLMRGDFLSRTEGIARAIQGGYLTPNEGRDLENRPQHANPAADELYMQGATVPLGTTPTGDTDV